MGIATFPAAAGGGIKLVQRGEAVASGNVTITAVDTAKSFVNIFGTASSGTVAASFGLNNQNFNLLGSNFSVGSGDNFNQGSTGPANRTSTESGNALATGNSAAFFNKTTAINASNVNSGTNNLVSAVVQGFLADSTTLTVSGACRWEVVEFA
jgi:hypothetical protein